MPAIPMEERLATLLRGSLSGVVQEYEQRSKRKYESCRQAIHVIATAINEPSSPMVL